MEREWQRHLLGMTNGVTGLTSSAACSVQRRRRLRTDGEVKEEEGGEREGMNMKTTELVSQGRPWLTRLLY